MSIKDLRLTDDQLAILGGRIKLARKYSHYTQNEAAEMLECSIGHLSAVENGKTMASGDELVGFCKLYEKDMSYFFGDIIGSKSKLSREDTLSWLKQYGYVSDETIKWTRRILSSIVEDLEKEEMERERK